MKKKSIQFVLFAFCINASFAQSVGTTEGVFNVSDLGAANYNIPIKVPDGINGIQPSLSLAYNSQGGYGPLGMGWSVSGLSAIVRTGNTIYHDSKVNAISLTNQDKFALDGNRLIIINGTYGATTSIYRTEVETFKNITANGTLGNGPQSFTVTDQNGWTYEYGNTVDSRQIPVGKAEATAWYLNKMKDLNGNYITYEYTNVNGEVLPQYIKYNCNQNTGLTFQSYVSFSYTTDPNPNFANVAGGKINSSKRINKISVIQKVGSVWKYYRSYTPEYTDNYHTHLTKVTERGNNETEALPATEFTYGAPSFTLYVTPKSDLYSASGRGYAVGDYNADGLSDVIDYSNADGGTFRLLLRNTSSGYTLAQTGIFENGFGNYAIENAIEKERSNLMYFDYNGDGKSDFARMQKFVNGSGVSQQAYWVYTSTGNAVANIGKVVRTDNSSVVNPYVFGYTLPFSGDFDGDGKSEMLLLNTYLQQPNQPTPSPNNFLIGEKYCTPVPASTFGYNALKAKALGNIGFDAAYLSLGGSKLYVVDYNGDGKSDILAIWHDNTLNIDHAQTWTLNVTFDANNNPVIGSPAFINVADCTHPTLNHDIFPGDFNGDRITDYLTFKNSDGWKIAYGKGNGMMNDIVAAPANMIQQPAYYPGQTNADGTRPIIIADFNGDGRDDIFDLYNNHTGYSSNLGGNYKFFYSIGNNAFAEENIPSVFNLFEMGKNAGNYWLGDFDGDSQVDIITKSEENNNTPLELLFRPNDSRDVLTQVKNGLGALTKINYLLLTNNAVYNNQSVNTYTYPYIKKTVAFKVVSNINSDNGINAAGNNVTYYYRGLKYHTFGKGLLGFDNVRSYDVSTRMISEKQFAVNTTYALPYLQASYNKYLQLNNITEEVLNAQLNTYGVYNYGNKRIFSYQTTAQEYNALTGETATTTNNYSFYTPPITGDNGSAGSNYSGKPFSTTINKGNGLTISTQTFHYPWRLPSNAAANSGEPYAGQVYINSKPYKTVTTTTRQGQPSYTNTLTYTYDNTTGQLTQTIKNPNTTNELYNMFFYNGYGNPITKYTFGNGVPIKQLELEYDPSNRYTTKSYFAAYPSIQDNATYDPLTGNKLTETGSDGFTKTYTYDGFSRITGISDNNGLSSTTSYTWGTSVPGGNGGVINGIYYITESSNTGATCYTAYDRLDRKKKTRYKNFQGQWINVDLGYNPIGQLTSTSNPYFTLGTTHYSTQGYDTYGRLSWTDTYPSGMTFLTYSPAGNNYLIATSTNPAGQVTSVKTDASGVKVSNTDADNNVMSYIYHSNGNVKSVSNGSNTLQTYTYDNFNRLTERWDPNYGTYTYTYDAYGRTLSQTDPKNQTYDYKYDALDRMYQKTGPEGVYNYTFENGPGLNCNKMTKQTGPEGDILYDYGAGGKINSVTYDDNGLAAGLTGVSSYGNYNYTYNYNSYGMLESKNYSTGLSLAYEYGANSELIAVNDFNTGTTFYQKLSENALGKTTAYMQHSGPGGTDLTTEINFDPYTDLLTGQKTTSGAGTLRHMTYNFDPATGNLLGRSDNQYGLEETFGYNDNLKRLTDITNTNNSALNMNMQYNVNGNITEKTDAGGSFDYDQANRLSMITLNGAQPQNIPHITQQLDYTAFDNVKSIKEGDYHTEFHYWPDGSRSMMVTTNDATGIQEYKMYAPDIESKYNTVSGDGGLCTYIQNPKGDVVGMHTNGPGGSANYFVLTDYLGSFTQIVDDWGNIAEEKSFDAWGRLRNPQTWEPYASNIDAGQPPQHFDRGYTGHEHLPYYGIINMNARLYDPVMGRMFSPDVNIIGSDNFQGYNRYSYALNNPLKYTDPSGDHPLIVAMAIGAAISALTYTASVAWSDGGFSNWNWGKFGYNVGTGAIIGAISAGAGTALGTALFGPTGGTGFFSGALTGGVAGGVGGFLGGVNSGMMAGSSNPFMDGLKSASIGAGIGGIINGISAGIEASDAHANFFTAKAELDLSNGYGAHGIKDVYQKVVGRYVGKYQGSNVYESPQLGEGIYSGGITLPGYGITVGTGVYTQNLYPTLLQHEFGHILQARSVGILSWYKEVGPKSLLSAIVNDGGRHNNFWTETWANYLSSQTISGYIPSAEFPIKDISWWHKLYLISRNF